ncbi:TonB-dependent receptor [Enterovirga sp. CN4-39]|uniref:TonB-dependent receptor n=1 Tax=Enterovirga sp. CN4-39 TaxID=3400910 RepID=UPI003BFD2FE7
MRLALPAVLALAGFAATATALAQPGLPAPTSLDEIVVTATGIPTRQSEVAATTQVIDREKIGHSSAKSLTDLLAENAAGFLSEWAPGQTSINIRGGATDGQGRDFKGQVLVLINGRRAGTANLSKLSVADVERIEIVRGPASVIYGSQNIGGVINIILKTGRTAPGSLIEGTTGLWELAQGRAQTGGTVEGVDYYLGVSGSRRGDYDAGGGRRQINTSWKRNGLTGAFGFQVHPDHRFDFTFRTDGIYDSGFRGSSANYLSRDNRFNASFDASYSGVALDGGANLFAQFYAVRDVDQFKWASPVVRSGSLPAPGTSSDYNKRGLDIAGTRLQPRFTLWEGNELLIGHDWEESVLRSHRYRIGVPGNVLAQVPPYDNNQTDRSQAIYFENIQKLFDNRVTLRGGLRQTWGRTYFQQTPYLAAQRPASNPYDALTYSAGAAWTASDWLALRVGASSGFRAPTATELAADFTALGGGRTFGNPNLKPETSDQIEVGATFAGPGWRLDAALFQNVIQDRITTRLRPGVANTSDYVNNPGDVLIRGIELQYDQDMLALIGRQSDAWRWQFYANGSYNFDMKDKGSLTVATANTHNVERVYRYQAALGTRFGSIGTAHDWTIQVQSIIRGPVYYNTEENLLVPEVEPYREYIWKKSPFAIWNVRGEVQLDEGVQLYLAVNNVFDVNNHPLFIANDKGAVVADLRFYNGGIGTSMPGRDVQVGVQARF